MSQNDNCHFAGSTLRYSARSYGKESWEGTPAEESLEASSKNRQREARVRTLLTCWADCSSPVTGREGWMVAGGQPCTVCVCSV